MRSERTDDEGRLVWRISDWDSLLKEELYEILRLRQEVFVLEQYCPFIDNDNWDQQGVHLWVCRSPEKRVLGYSRVLPPNTLYEEASFGRVVVDRSARGQKLGVQLVENSIVLMDERGYGAIKILAQHYLLDFYARFGFSRQEKVWEDDILHYHMLRQA
jgi:ElaA protein